MAKKLDRKWYIFYVYCFIKMKRKTLEGKKLKYLQ